MTHVKHGARYLLLTVVAVILLFPILLGIWASLLPTKDIAAVSYTHLRAHET